jgi:type IV secretory pathway VirD2 relaxase
VVDLRPGGTGEDPELKRLMIGRAAKLERLGLAEQIGSARWELKPGLEPALRDLGIRGDIIKTMHRAMTAAGHEPDVTGFALHGDRPADPVLGRLVVRADCTTSSKDPPTSSSRALMGAPTILLFPAWS